MIHQFGSLLALFFGIFSEAGAWSAGEVAGWFRDAGLEAKEPWSHWMMHDLALHIAHEYGQCSAGRSVLRVPRDRALRPSVKKTEGRK
jgi:hypothetical protein